MGFLPYIALPFAKSIERTADPTSPQWPVPEFKLEPPIHETVSKLPCSTSDFPAPSSSCWRLLPPQDLMGSLECIQWVMVSPRTSNAFSLKKEMVKQILIWSGYAKNNYSFQIGWNFLLLIRRNALNVICHKNPLASLPADIQIWLHFNLPFIICYTYH